MKRLIDVNDQGYRVGESHHNARLSNAQVEDMREKYEHHFWGYRRLAKQFGVSRTTVKRICLMEQRNQTADRVKTVDK